MTGRGFAGARVVFSRGSVCLTPETPTPAGWAAARFSVVSPGTELRRLAATVNGGDHAAGYMTVAPAGNGSGLRLAPVPHGAPVHPDDSPALPIPGDTAIEYVAVARFQLMAALGLTRFATYLRYAHQVVVIGGGPVAVGCVLELRRIGVHHIVSVTRHPKPAAADLPHVTVSRHAPTARPPVVIDCTGRVEDGIRMVAPGGLLGLLGTPAHDATLPAAVVHRSGTTIVGMHELAMEHPPARCHLFDTVLRWVTTAVDSDTVRSWCHIMPGDHAVRLYRELSGAHRPVTPFLVLEWS